MDLVGPMVAPQNGAGGRQGVSMGHLSYTCLGPFSPSQQFSLAASVPTGAVAWPRRGSPGLAGVWWGNMCVVVGAVGRMAGAHSGKDAHRNVWAPSGPVSGACVGPSRPTESELYAQNLPYKFKKSYGDLQNRNFEKSYRTTGPWSDLSPDS